MSPKTSLITTFFFSLAFSFNSSSLSVGEFLNPLMISLTFLVNSFFLSSIDLSCSDFSISYSFFIVSSALSSYFSNFNFSLSDLFSFLICFFMTSFSFFTIISVSGTEVVFFLLCFFFLSSSLIFSRSTPLP